MVEVFEGFLGYLSEVLGDLDLDLDLDRDDLLDALAS